MWGIRRVIELNTCGNKEMRMKNAQKKGTFFLKNGNSFLQMWIFHLDACWSHKLTYSILLLALTFLPNQGREMSG